MEYLSPMLDVIFKKMFAMEENKDMLRGLVKAFLEVDIGTDFTIAGNDLPPQEADGKFPRIDLHVSGQRGEVDIDVQVEYDRNFSPRLLHYAMQLYISSVKRGDTLYRPRTTLALGITDFAIPENNSPKWVTEFGIYEKDYHIPLTNRFKIFFAELPKTREATWEEIRNDPRLAWAKYFRSRREEDFNMLRENTTNRDIQKAIDVLSDISIDPETRELARRRENDRILQSSMLSGARDEGVDELANVLLGLGMDKDKIEEGIRLIRGAQSNSAVINDAPGESDNDESDNNDDNCDMGR